MCFSANANFAASAVIAGIGIATLPHVRHPRGVLFAVTPILLALHQFTEGFVWLGLDDRIGQTAFQNVVFLFMLYAQGVLPILIPLSVLLMDPAGWRRGAIGVLTGFGILLALWITRAVVAIPTVAVIEHHSITYRNAGTQNDWLAAGYVLACCGSLLLSTHRTVRWFGILNALGLIVVALIKGYAFTSVWCLYAAVLSMMIYWQYRHQHIDILRPNSTFAADTTRGSTPV